MTAYLLDTCVVSEAMKKQPDPEVALFLGRPGEAHEISVITIGEIERGVRRLADGKRKSELLDWVAGIPELYKGRILDCTVGVARTWGVVMARAEQQGLSLPAIDTWIAATALVNSCRVATRNTRHFVGAGCTVYNPWTRELFQP